MNIDIAMAILLIAWFITIIVIYRDEVKEYAKPNPLKAPREAPSGVFFSPFAVGFYASAALYFMAHYDDITKISHFLGFGGIF